MEKLIYKGLFPPRHSNPWKAESQPLPYFPKQQLAKVSVCAFACVCVFAYVLERHRAAENCM